MTKRKSWLKFNKNHFEALAWENQNVVVGIDEVGRGCLAGPLVTAAVILPPFKLSRRLKDSKIMTPEEREAAFNWIVSHCEYNIGIVHNRLIDQHNIYHATLIAMKKALVNLLATSVYERPVGILVDAMPLQLLDTNYKDIPVHYFPFGERKSSSIAAASIVAKVTRDALMSHYDVMFPGYALEQHKGYSTPNHKKAVIAQRHSIIHRMSFIENVIANHCAPNIDEQEQQSIL